jgi:probable F420-dependent oxidoreductase
MSGGRLILGLGSQVKGHVERRFGMRWETPAPKMTEVIGVLRAVWAAWQSGSKLDFQGTFYRIDLMTPFFSPPPISFPRIPIYVAGVNRGMCQVAAESGDGLLVHPLHTVRYLREVMLPAMTAGLAKGGKEKGDVTVAASVFAAVGNDEKEIRKMKDQCRAHIAFYASTRTYSRVLELHGWGDVCNRLHRFSLGGEWGRMAAEIDDDILDEFIVEGTWVELGDVIRDRYRGLADRVRLYLPFDGKEEWRMLLRAFSA